jgi:primase-polymerase (primpol)-like protein
MDSPKFENIPAELRECPQWVVWRLIPDPDDIAAKPKKLPYNARTGKMASSVNHSHWSTFEVAKAAYEASLQWKNTNGRQPYAGVGFVLSEDDPYLGIDLDHCYDERGFLEPWASSVMNRMASYTERSPSGEGLRIFIRGSLPTDFKRKGRYEFYTSARYLTVTGDIVGEPGRGIEDRAEEFNALHAEIFPPEPLSPPLPVSKSSTRALGSSLSGRPLTDDEIIERISGSQSNPSDRAYWDGDLTQSGGDHSKADLALMGVIAFYCNRDLVQMDRIFRRSALMRPKWDQRRGSQTYGAMTIAKSMRDRTSYYEPRTAQPLGWTPLPGDNDAPFSINEDVDIDSHIECGDGDTAEEEIIGDEPSELNVVRADENAQDLDDAIPIIETYNRHLREIMIDTMSAIIQKNDPPFIFVQGANLVRGHEVTDQNITRYNIQILGENELRCELTKCCRFVSTRWVERRKEMVTYAALEPRNLVKTILAMPIWPGIPRLNGVVTSPVVSRSGIVCTQPKYQPETELYYYASDDYKEIGDTTPTGENLAAAKAMIDDLIVDFPFLDSASRTGAIALLILPFVRALIDGATPVHQIDAPVAGTGKSLLAEVLALVFNPSGVGFMSPPPNEEKLAERISESLSQGESHVILDNVRHLSSTTFLSAVTASAFKSRLLYQNGQMLPVRCVWVLTGNNITGNDELRRRSVLIRIDPGIERPEDRTGYKHDPLKPWVLEHRSEILCAVLIIVRHWIAEGRPGPKKVPSFGSFEQWRWVMGGILESAGFEDLLANKVYHAERMEANDAQAMSGFVSVWWDRFGSAPKPVAELSDIAAECLDLADKSGRSISNALAKKMQIYADRVFDGIKICIGDTPRSGINRYRTHYFLQDVHKKNKDSVVNNDPYSEL